MAVRQQKGAVFVTTARAHASTARDVAGGACLLRYDSPTTSSQGQPRSALQSPDAMKSPKSSRITRVPLEPNRESLLRAVLTSDVVVTTLAITFYCSAMCIGMFFLCWWIYNERYGITVRDFLMLAF